MKKLLLLLLLLPFTSCVMEDRTTAGEIIENNGHFDSITDNDLDSMKLYKDSLK